MDMSIRLRRPNETPNVDANDQRSPETPNEHSAPVPQETGRDDR